MARGPRGRTATHSEQAARSMAGSPPPFAFHGQRSACNPLSPHQPRREGAAAGSPGSLVGGVPSTLRSTPSSHAASLAPGAAASCAFLSSSLAAAPLDAAAAWDAFSRRAFCLEALLWYTSRLREAAARGGASFSCCALFPSSTPPPSCCWDRCCCPPDVSAGTGRESDSGAPAGFPEDPGCPPSSSARASCSFAGGKASSAIA